MVTGNASKENVHEALERGAAGFVIKPFNAATVLETINRAWHLLEQKKPPPAKE
jgi:two-component system chemotaxis response regulator CheY